MGTFSRDPNSLGGLSGDGVAPEHRPGDIRYTNVTFSAFFAARSLPFLLQPSLRSDPKRAIQLGKGQYLGSRYAADPNSCPTHAQLEEAVLLLRQFMQCTTRIATTLQSPNNRCSCSLSGCLSTMSSDSAERLFSNCSFYLTGVICEFFPGAHSPLFSK